VEIRGAGVDQARKSKDKGGEKTKPPKKLSKNVIAFRQRCAFSARPARKVRGIPIAVRLYFRPTFGNRQSFAGYDMCGCG
jgi:hypothetical protein